MPCILIKDYANNLDPTNCLFCSNACSEAFPPGCEVSCGWPNKIDECSLMASCKCYSEPTPERTQAIADWMRQDKVHRKAAAKANAEIKRRRNILSMHGKGWEI